MEATWLALLTGISGVAVTLLGILLGSLHVWKLEVREYIEKVCEDNKQAHDDMWERINYHKHNGGGSVVIPQKG
jgi:hypothetical protein